ncbi:MAG: type I phosphomannose isomerase catalytic subunit [Terriglobia bacterium]
MPKLDSPLQLSPVFKLKIWGRENLSPLFSRPQELAKTHLRHELIGEVWITDDESRFMNSAIAGMTLAEASAKFGPQLCGKNWNDSRFPVLAKYIYTSDWLSVQVHPDDAEAGRYDPGNRGKSEMWYIVKSDRKAEILLGLKSGVTKDGLRAAFEKAASKKLLKRFHPKAGEAIYVPPGTVHALGPGLVLFEVEENSDLTYRLDDFGRVGLDGKPRPLHLDKGLAVTHVELPPLRDLPRVVLRETYGTRRFVLACPYFAMEELLLARRGTFAGTPERVEVLTVLDGAGRVETSAGWLGYRTGDTWLIPPGAMDYRLVPRRETRLLKFYVPDLEIDFRRPLAKRGVRASKIRRIVFD